MFNNFRRKKINNKRFLNRAKQNNSNVNQIDLNTSIDFNDNTSNKKQNIIIKIVFIIIFISIILFWFLYKWYYNFKNNILIENKQVIQIQTWDNISNLAKKLNINKNYLKIYINKNKPDFKLIKWNFQISENANINQILLDLQTPIIENQINITILEWWNIFDIDNYLTNKKLIKSGEYIKYVTSKEKIIKLTEFFPFINWLETLEWFLYPDTYTVISNNFKINVLVIKQLENFENKVYNKLFKNYKNKDIEKIINLASIVEKEEKNIQAKPTVAWILKKRLQNWWMIWADITVCYPHKLTANQCKMVITKYINEKSDYNTRTMTWLPKTPIWNPSFETINATINYKKTPYWFYLHNSKTWKIYYAETNQWHTINKNRYLR